MLTAQTLNFDAKIHLNSKHDSNFSYTFSLRCLLNHFSRALWAHLSVRVLSSTLSSASIMDFMCVVLSLSHCLPFPVEALLYSDINNASGCCVNTDDDSLKGCTYISVVGICIATKKLFGSCMSMGFLCDHTLVPLCQMLC